MLVHVLDPPSVEYVHGLSVCPCMVGGRNKIIETVFDFRVY